MRPEIALDREIALRYVRFLLDKGLDDGAEPRRLFCEEAGVHPKLLYYNPHVKAVAAMFGDQSSLERLMDMTLRDWMQYHYYYIHQGYRYGAEKLQQRWLGQDIIKSPMDCWVYQEIIHDTRPDIILELGVMFGGATRFFASICDLVGHGRVIGVDISLSKVGTIDHPRVELIEGSSVGDEVFRKIEAAAAGKKVLVVADSDHEKSHVLQEIRLYSRFVPVGGYFIVEDSANDPMHFHPVPNEGPQAAALEFLRENDDFVADRRYAEKYILSINPYGYLLRVK